MLLRIDRHQYLCVSGITEERGKAVQVVRRV
ncbi:MAG: hypothetical protein V7640_1038 [Betaproteobacteria bacterium]